MGVPGPASPILRLRKAKEEAAVPSSFDNATYEPPAPAVLTPYVQAETNEL